MTTHLTHWGAFEAASDGERLVSVRPWAGDPDPRPLIDNVASAQHHPARIDQPHVRRGWLEHGPGPSTPAAQRAVRRGELGHAPSTWSPPSCAGSAPSTATQAVYGGSYGWASAGRFHHAQSQLHRFLNLAGGYTGSRQHLQPGHLRGAAAARRRQHRGRVFGGGVVVDHASPGTPS